MVLSSFVLSFTTPDLSLFPLKDLTDRDRSTGMACRGLVESVSQWGEGRHIPGHLREAQLAIPIQVEHPQLLGTERGAWVIRSDFLSCGTSPAMPFLLERKKDGWSMLVPPLRSPGGQGPTWSPSVPGETAGTQSLLLSPPRREKATEESGPAPKAHAFRVYPLLVLVLRALSQKQPLLVSASTSVSTCGGIPFASCHRESLPLGLKNQPTKNPSKPERHRLGGPRPAPPGQGGTRLSTHYGLGVLLELGFIVRPVRLLQQVRQESLEHKRPFRAPSSDSPPLAHSAVHAICIGFIPHKSLTP